MGNKVVTPEPEDPLPLPGTPPKSVLDEVRRGSKESCGSSRKFSVSQSEKPQTGKKQTKSSSDEDSSNEDDESLKLTNAQISLVRKAWTQARTRGPTEPALSLFYYMCLKAQDTRKVMTNTSVEQQNEEISVAQQEDTVKP